MAALTACIELFGSYLTVCPETRFLEPGPDALNAASVLRMNGGVATHTLMLLHEGIVNQTWRAHTNNNHTSVSGSPFTKTKTFNNHAVAFEGASSQTSGHNKMFLCSESYLCWGMSSRPPNYLATTL